MRYSGIGGQAVMEGVMMKNQDSYAIAVRKPNQEIEIKVQDYKGPGAGSIWRKLPIIRGVIAFVDSLTLGMGSLMYSASFLEEEEDTSAMTEEEKAAFGKKKKKEDDTFMGGTLVLSIILAVAIFFALPYGLSLLLSKVVSNGFVLALIEGLIRMAIFIGYVASISLMPDIKRTYMYHGAEHKCINCIEHGLELTVENVKKSSRLHKRCGTSFLLIVMIVSIIFFFFIQVDNPILRIVLRLVLIPVIAGVSYEFIRLAGKYDNFLVNAFSAPGLWMQHLTTKEPDETMIEVGIASVEAVFDWKKWQEENNDL